MRTSLSQNKPWNPPPANSNQCRARGRGRGNHPPPPFRGASWMMPPCPPPFRPHFPPPNHPDMMARGSPFRHPFAPRPPPSLPNRSEQSSPVRAATLSTPASAPASVPASSPAPASEPRASPTRPATGASYDEMDTLLQRAQTMQAKFRLQRQEAKKREEEERQEKEKRPIREVEAKLKKAEEANLGKIKGLITEEKMVSSSEPASKTIVQASPKRAAAGGPAALLNMISMPRSRRERRQVEDIIRKASQRRTSRPRLQPHPSTSESEAVEDSEGPALPSQVVEAILRHEKSGDGESLPVVDLNLDEVTSGVTSLSDSARPLEKNGEEVVDTSRSGVSVLSPAPKKRKTDEDDDAMPASASSVGDSVSQSEEVTRMQLALELSVQEEGLRRRMKELDAQIDEQKVIMEAVLRRIEELEMKKTKIRLEERSVHERRMGILKESYAKVLASASETVTSMSGRTETETEADVADSSVATDSFVSDTSASMTTSSSRRIVKQEQVDSCTPVDEAPEDYDDDAEEEEEEEEPLIGNMTAREIRERAMSAVGSGALSFGDLDDVINELMRVSNTAGDTDAADTLPDTCVSQSTPRTTEEEEEEPARRTRKTTQKRRLKADKEEHTADESVVSDVMSARKSDRGRKRVSSAASDASETPRATASRSRRSGPRSQSPVSSEGSGTNLSGGDELSHRSASPVAVAAFPGTLEGHDEKILDMQLFRGYVYTCAVDGSVRKFNLQTHTCVVEYLGFKKAVLSLCVTEKPKGRPRLFSGGVENTLIVHDVKTGTELQRLSMDAQIHCMHLHWFSLYLGLSNGVIVTYDVRKNRVISSRKVSPSEICSLQATREGARRVLVVASADGKIAVRDVNSGNHMHAVGDMNAPMQSLRVRVLHHSVFAATDDGRLREFSLLGHSMMKQRWLSARVTSVFAQLNVDFLLLGCDDGSVRMLQAEQKSRMKVLYTGKRCPVTAVCCHIYNGDGVIVAGLKDGNIVILRLTNTSVDCKFGSCTLQFESVDDLIYHVTRDHILSSSEREVRCCWDSKCKSRFSMMDDQANEMHIRSHLGV